MSKGKSRQFSTAGGYVPSLFNDRDFLISRGLQAPTVVDQLTDFSAPATAVETPKLTTAQAMAKVATGPVDRGVPATWRIDVLPDLDKLAKVLTDYNLHSDVDSRPADQTGEQAFLTLEDVVAEFGVDLGHDIAEDRDFDASLTVQDSWFDSDAVVSGTRTDSDVSRDEQHREHASAKADDAYTNAQQSEYELGLLKRDDLRKMAVEAKIPNVRSLTKAQLIEALTSR